MAAQSSSDSRGVTVFCASSSGLQKAYQHSAVSLGHALAETQRPLIYGGGSAGLMGAVSGAVLERSGEVTGVTPFAMVAAGGEKDATQTTNGGHKTGAHVRLDEEGREKVETIIVNSMHERKAEMAKRSGSFICLPGGYGTFEEILEIICWSQLGIHSKPVIVLNVRGFFNPLRELIRNAINEGFILAKNEFLVRFIDGPVDIDEHETFDWGKAAIEALDRWEQVVTSHYYDWTVRKEGKAEPLTAT